MLQIDRDYQESEVKRERNRNEIAYRTWQEAKVVLEEKLKKSQVDHQRIKDDLDNQLRKALHENLALQDSLREWDNRLEQLERERTREKSVASVAMQVSTLGSSELDCESLRRKVEMLQKQLQSVGRYNEELLEKYEPQSHHQRRRKIRRRTRRKRTLRYLVQYQDGRG